MIKINCANSIEIIFIILAKIIIFHIGFSIIEIKESNL